PTSRRRLHCATRGRRAEKPSLLRWTSGFTHVADRDRSAPLRTRGSPISLCGNLGISVASGSIPILILISTQAGGFVACGRGKRCPACNRRTREVAWVVER